MVGGIFETSARNIHAMKIKVFKTGFNYSQDGPGNRLVVHLQGCNLHCPWCANPEGMAMGAAGEEWEAAGLVRFCEESSMLFFDGGGVTFTGGEPTMQIEALREVLETLRGLKIHTVIETNGTSPHLAGLFPLVDQLIMDFKTPFVNQHAALLGPGGEILLENIKTAILKHTNLIIRTPLIDGFNTSQETLDGFLEVIGRGPKPNVCFEFLRYHEAGKEKWRQCGMEYKQPPSFVSDDVIRYFEDAYRKRGLNVIRT